MKRILHYLFVFLILSCFSCSSDSSRKLDFDVSSIDIPDFKIERYEKALFQMDTLNFLHGIKEIQEKYKVFLGDENIDENSIQSLRNYVTDPTLIELYKKIELYFSDLSHIEKELRTAFKYYHFYFPDEKLPLIYTYISGFHFENPVQLSAEAMVIGLDLYLGADFEEYKKYGIPAYKTSRMTKEHLSIDCIKEMARTHLFENRATLNFLDEIIENAKTLYFMDAILPEKADHLKIAYTEDQINWCIQNEQNIWAFFIDKHILYSADYEVNRKFIQEGPFTQAFSKDAPARIGNWIGWQILRSYMNNNPGVGLPELLQETDAQKILKKSAYKPKQK